MKLIAITWLHNDAMIAPFIMSHYAFADKMIVMVDDRTTDSSAEIASRYPNAQIMPFFSDKANCKVCTDAVNNVMKGLDCDWIINTCNDEFAFPKNGADWRETLSSVSGNVVYVDMWQVYRHRTDSDLDPSKPAIYQRRHGDPNRDTGINAAYKKPMIVAPGCGIEFTIGFHSCKPNNNIVVAEKRFDGAHWIMADPALAIARRMRGTRANQNSMNLSAGWGYQHFDVDERRILRECEEHLDDPQLF
jgi:hypothetical protein